MKTLLISLFATFLFVGQSFAMVSSGVDDALALVSKELNLSAVQKPSVKSVLTEFAPKVKELATANLASNALSSDASNKLFGELKTSLGKVLNASQLAKLDGLQQKLISLLGA